MTIKRKRNKRRHYKTGIHKSDKCINGPIKYRSGWEHTVCEYLDKNPMVESYSYETIRIEYVSNYRTGKTRIYIPDFLIVYLDKTKKLVEVKRKSQLNARAVLKKAAAAEKWAKKKGIQYEIWSEAEINSLKKIQKTQEKI